MAKTMQLLRATGCRSVAALDLDFSGSAPQLGRIRGVEPSPALIAGAR